MYLIGSCRNNYVLTAIPG